MAKLKGSANKKARFQVYKSSGRYAKNRKVKLERHLELHPEDVQAKNALKNISDKPRRSSHVPSGDHSYKEITEVKVKNGKSTVVVVKKIRLSRLDKQLARLVKQAEKVKVTKTDTDKLFAALSLAQTLEVLNAHNQRLYDEYIAKLKAEGKPLPKSELKKQKNKNGKRDKGDANRNKSGKSVKTQKSGKAKIQK